MFIENSLMLVGMVGLVFFLTGLSKGGLGGTMGFLLTPLLALVMPTNKAVGLLLPILMLADVFAVATYWRSWDVKIVRILLAGAVIGVTLATFVLTSFPPEWLRRGLGVLSLLFVFYRVFEQRILRALVYEPHTWHGVSAGSLAGFTSTLAHAGGPPITVYLMFQKVAPEVFIATSALFFAILNWIKVPYYYFGGLFDFALLFRLIWLAPLVVLGVWCGRWLVKHINRVWFDRIILVMLFISGILLLV
jgi:uncharacterized protein